MDANVGPVVVIERWQKITYGEALVASTGWQRVLSKDKFAKVLNCLRRWRDGCRLRREMPWGPSSGVQPHRSRDPEVRSQSKADPRYMVRDRPLLDLINALTLVWRG